MSHLAPLRSGPYHEGVHGPLDVIHRLGHVAVASGPRLQQPPATRAVGLGPEEINIGCSRRPSALRGGGGEGGGWGSSPGPRRAPPAARLSPAELLRTNPLRRETSWGRDRCSERTPTPRWQPWGARGKAVLTFQGSVSANSPAGLPCPSAFQTRGSAQSCPRGLSEQEAGVLGFGFFSLVTFSFDSTRCRWNEAGGKEERWGK